MVVIKSKNQNKKFLGPDQIINEMLKKGLQYITQDLKDKFKSSNLHKQVSFIQKRSIHGLSFLFSIYTSTTQHTKYRTED